jgi:hypothetical protein
MHYAYNKCEVRAHTTKSTILNLTYLLPGSLLLLPGSLLLLLLGKHGLLLLGTRGLLRGSLCGSLLRETRIACLGTPLGSTLADHTSQVNTQINYTT